MYYNIPHMQAKSGDQPEAAEIQTLQHQILQLWKIIGGESNSALLVTMKNRAADALREVARHGWEDYQTICEEAVEAARKLWRQCEALVIAAGEVGGTEGNALLHGSKRLLTACDLLVASEEEIVSLMDTGMEAYRWAHQNGELGWQHQFSLSRRGVMWCVLY
jgi:hypothetical protein